jgi:hypothetical protein
MGVACNTDISATKFVMFGIMDDNISDNLTIFDGPFFNNSTKLKINVTMQLQ